MNLNTQIERVLGHLCAAGEFLGADVYVFGVNGYSKTIAAALAKNHCEVRAFLDNNANKHGAPLMGIPVCAPGGALLPFNAGAKILIASKYYAEMKNQLEEMGYRERANILKLLDADALCDPDFLAEDLLAAHFQSARDGLALFCELQEKHGGPAPLFLCPVSSIGDVFLLGLYFNRFVEKNNIEKYIFAVPSKAGAHIAQTYGIKNVEPLTQQQADSLLNLRMLAGRQHANVLVLHAGYLHQRILCNLLMYENMTWLDNYKRFLFGLGEDEPFTPRTVFPNERLIDETFTSLGLRPGNTVVLSPYAQTLAALSPGFWERLAGALRAQGFCVCTNVAGSEEPVAGTIALQFSLDDADAVLARAGYFIGLRSGLCDIVSMAKCKKIILYTTEVFECVRVIDFYSLKRMRLCDDVVELEMTCDIQSDLDAVLRHMETGEEVSHG